MINKEQLAFLETTAQSEVMLNIAGKVINGERISEEEGVALYTEGELGYLAVLADIVRKRVNGDYVFFNRNFHIEPTNICINRCTFCSYRRQKGEEGSWEYSIEDIRKKVEGYAGSGVTEVHIVGGIHPDRDLDYYIKMIGAVKAANPDIHIKAFTAVEIDNMVKQSGISLSEGFARLKEAGLDSMPGGGAEIFDETLREKICPGKTGSSRWLEIHEAAHQFDIPTNSTMLYGLLENYNQRIDHMGRLRKLQDKTKGFNTFIPLKFKHYNNAYSRVPESTIIEDLKNYAVSRIFLDNIPHLKAYWPMVGKQVAQLSLAFGVDDLDGTIDDSTKIYSMAGSSEKNPTASTSELITMIKDAGFLPVERDTVYNIINLYYS
jgi:aminodeoxyfutalosine synthase